MITNSALSTEPARLLPSLSIAPILRARVTEALARSQPTTSSTPDSFRASPREPSY